MVMLELGTPWTLTAEFATWAKLHGGGLRASLRQSDVLLVRISEALVRPGGRRLLRDERARIDGRLILAYGEATGHAHVLDCPTAELLEATDGRRFLRTTEHARLEHEEHDPILEAGWYEVVRQRQYEPWSLSVDVRD